MRIRRKTPSCVQGGGVVVTLTDDVMMPDQEAAADKFRYVTWGSFDEPEKVPPKGEFFCKEKPEWMPDIPGMVSIRSSLEKLVTAC